MRCLRCSGNMLTEAFSDVYESGMRAVCILCGHEAETLNGTPRPTAAALRTIFAGAEYQGVRGRPRKAVS